MVNPLDLTKYTEDDEDEDEVFLESEQKKNKKRSDWAKGKSRAQPSENWDNDFLFGSVSTESLPLPSKTATRPNPPTRKPGSAHSTSASTHLQSSSLQHSLNQPLPQLPKHAPSNSRPLLRTANSHKTEDDSALNLIPQDSNCSTPRKKDPHCPRPHLSVPPSLSSFASSNSFFDPTASTSLRSSIKNTPKPQLHQPPASLPTFSRGLTHTALDLQNSSLDSASKASPKTMGRKGTVSDRTSRPSRPPLSLRTRQASHKAISSQDSVPSASELSSVDIRSPSSSLSTTDDGHGNWSRSSGDYSAGFGGSGKGNRSFNTETEFTEPDTELDWGDDTDFENRSSCSPANLRQSTDRALHRSQPATHTAKLNGNNPSRTSRSGSTAHSHHLNEPLRAISDSSSCRSNLASQPSPSPLESFSLSTSQKSNERNQVRRSAHSSFDSQTTFTTTHSSKSRNLNNPPSLNSAASSSSSIGYYKSNHSDISLKSSSSRVSRNSVEILTNNLSQNHEAHLRRQQARTPSLSSASSNFPLPYGNHSSDSYEAATSGTETDGLSDYAQAHRRKSPMASTSSSNRVTPNATQRSRKQALYSRPPNANPSSSVSSLAGSMSSTTLNMNSLLSPDRFTDDGDADADISIAPSNEDDSRLKNLRKRLRRKRPSALALSPTPINSPSTVLDRQTSISDSIYSDNYLSGDLAFAADSDEEGRGQLRRPSRAVAIGSTSPYQVIDPAEVLSINLRSPTPVAPGRGLNLRARSSVSHSGPNPSPLLNGPSSKAATAPEPGTMAKKFKSRRPLSFTALLSRNSIASISSAQTSTNIVGDRQIDSIPHSASSGRGLFARKSSETVRDQVSKKEIARTQSHSSGVDSESILSERPTRGHFRQSASIGSNPVNYKATKPSNTSLEPSESFISRVRRLSSRQSSHQKTPPVTPNRKRFSIMGGVTRTTPSQHLYSPPTTSSQAPSAASTPSSKRNHRSPTVSGITASTSKGSELTVRADSDAGRKARPSSKDSSSSRPSGLLRGSSLRRKFSSSTNNKASVDEPNLTVSPPAAPHSITDHNLSGSASSLGSSTGPRLRSMGSSKPPKSNPALRKRVAASVSATLEHYKIANPPTPTQTMDDFQLVSPKSPDFDLSPDPSLRSQSSRFMRSGDSTYAPNSEPLPDQSILPTNTISPIMSSSMGGMNAALGRSNSMGELRIPSRITSQQGRLHTELNQMKEFARGIDDLKLMRRNYRRLIESTTRAQLSSATSDSSMTASDENENQSTESPKMLSDDNESVQPSPRAVARISSNIARIELNYREWWTCCNVLIDLGEGEQDPKERFPRDRIATNSSEGSGSPKEGGKDSEEHEHFEILKNMFGPGGPIENETVKTPPKQQNMLRGERSFERTPVVKSQRVLKNVSSSGPILMMSPETPIARTLPDSDEFVIEDDDDDDGSVKGKEHLQNRKLWVNSPSEKSSEGHSESLRIEKTLRGKNHILRRSAGGNSSIRVCSEGCASVSSSGGGSRTSKSLIKSTPAPILSNQPPQSRKISLIMRNGSGKISGAGSARNALQGVKDFLRTLKAKIQEDKLIRKNTISSSSSISAISSNSSIFIEIEANSINHEISNSQSKEVSPTPSISLSSSSSSSEEECWDDQILEPTTSTLGIGNGNGIGGNGKKRLALSSERMPQLLSYLAIVRDQCEACLDELKSQTV